jgi:hypothetical protein
MKETSEGERPIKPGEDEAMEAAVRLQDEDPGRCCRCGQPWVMASFVAYRCHLDLEEWRFCTRHCMAAWLEEGDQEWAEESELERLRKGQAAVAKLRTQMNRKVRRLSDQLRRSKDKTGEAELEAEVKRLRERVRELLDEGKDRRAREKLDEVMGQNEVLSRENETLWARVHTLDEEIKGWKQEVERLKPYDVQARLNELR